MPTPSTEGKGRVLVTARVALSDHDLKVVELTGKRRDAYRGYKDRTDRWGRGLLGDESEPLPTFVGTAGEVIFIHWLRAACGVRLSIDDALRPHGDNGVDFEFLGLKVQVKCAWSRYRTLLHKVERHDVLPTGELAEGVPVWDVCVRCQWPHWDDPTDLNFGEVVGWVNRHDFRELGHVRPARRGDHLNVEVAALDLTPVSALADLVVARRELRVQ